MTDAIVVGAGPAGTTAAEHLAEKGYHVTVFEKGPLRREKPCGGGIPAVALREFSIDFEGGRVINGVFLCSPQNNTTTVRDEEGKGLSVMRADFDFYLVKRAAEKGVTFKENAVATPFLVGGALRGVRTKEGCHESDLTIVCDGAPSTFAREMHLFTGSCADQAVGFQYQMAVDNAVIEERIGNVLELYFGNAWIPQGYTWIFPKDGMVTVGNATWLSAVKQNQVNLRKSLDRFIERHPIACEKLKGTTILYAQSHLLWFPGIVKSVYGDHFMLAGDAGGFTSYATGGGLYYALISGKVAGEVGVEALERGDFSKDVLKQYRERMEKRIGADMRWGRFLRTVLLNTDSRQEVLVTAIQRDPWMRGLFRLLLKEEIRYDAFMLQLLTHPHRVIRALVL